MYIWGTDMYGLRIDFFAPFYVDTKNKPEALFRLLKTCVNHCTYATLVRLLFREYGSHVPSNAFSDLNMGMEASWSMFFYSLVSNSETQIDDCLMLIS